MFSQRHTRLLYRPERIPTPARSALLMDTFAMRAAPETCRAIAVCGVAGSALAQLRSLCAPFVAARQTRSVASLLRVLATPDGVVAQLFVTSPDTDPRRDNRQETGSV